MRQELIIFFIYIIIYMSKSTDTTYNKIGNIAVVECEKSLQTMKNWQDDKEVVETIIPIIGRLYRYNNITPLLFSNSLVNLSTMEIISLHSRVCENNNIKIKDMCEIINTLQYSNITQMSVDIGQLSLIVANARIKGCFFSVFSEINKFTSKYEKSVIIPRDVVLYGFGRIGRLLARILVEKTHSDLRLRAIVVRKKNVPDLVKRANLMMYDSVHSTFNGVIEVDENRNVIIANGHTIQLIYSKSPDSVDYTKYGINNCIVVDNTGIWRDKNGLGLHLKSEGVSEVVLTAPGVGDVPNIVMGVNSSDYFDGRSHKIFSASSCSTNAITPVLKLVDDEFGIEFGHLETIHSFTNDQNLIDNFHKKSRRGRSAVLNMVITETGVAKAASKVLPKMEGKLTASAIRVPTPNVSMAILILNLSRPTTTQELNDYIQKQSVSGALMHQIDFSNSTEAVSSDFVGTRATAIIDGPNTTVTGKRCNLYIWYDNEFGYSCQVMRLLKKICSTSTN
jgi:glyceraldehyde 3-phosphate dehydrogenase